MKNAAQPWRSALGNLQPHEVQRRHQALLAHWAGTARAPVVVMREGADAAARPGGDAKKPAAGGAAAQAVCQGVYQIVSYAQAWRWAAEMGMLKRRQPLDLKAVNALRKSQGEVPFALKGAA